MTTRINIIIPVYNKMNYTLQIIDCINKNVKIPYVMTIIDNCSTDGTREFLDGVASNCPQVVKVIHNTKNYGLSKAWNQGILSYREMDYHVLLSNDVLFRSGCIERLIEIIDKDKNLGIISPLPIDGDFCLREHWEAHAVQFEEINKGKVMDGLHGCLYIIRKEVFDKIGLFDEAYFILGQDIDICKRVEDAGFETRIILDNVIYHFGAQTQILLEPSVREVYNRTDIDIYFKKFGYPEGNFTFNSGKMRIVK